MGGHRPATERQQRPRRSPRDERVERSDLRSQTLGPVPARRGSDQTGLEAQGYGPGRRVRDVVPADVPKDPRRGVDGHARVPTADGLRARTGGDHVRARRVVARGAQLGPHGGGDAERGDDGSVPTGVADDQARAPEDVESVAEKVEGEAAGPGGGGGRPAAAGGDERERKDELEFELEFVGGELGHRAGHERPGVRGRQRRGDEAQQAVPRVQRWEQHPGERRDADGDGAGEESAG